MPALVQHFTWGTGNATTNEDRTKHKPLQEGTFGAVSAIAVGPEGFLKPEFIEEVFTGLVRTVLLSAADLATRIDAEFGPGVLVDALQLIARQALDDWIQRLLHRTASAPAVTF
ncbi:hypothetical protein DL771_000955 [Monosporascus sp. 5C6A]|nr:hypothetical protein DL771_000955 [Monosporascus sp. 5C6A]